MILHGDPPLASYSSAAIRSRLPPIGGGRLPGSTADNRRHRRHRYVAESGLFSSGALVGHCHDRNRSFDLSPSLAALVRT
jgi:hypothetical protein